MDAERRTVDDLLAAAAVVTGTAVELVDDLSFSSRAVVARVRLGAGATAIAKMPFEAESFTNEVHAFQFLPPGVRPALIGSADGVFVMEDLGTGPSLADVLLGDDRAAAERALLAWATALGTAVGATMRSGAPAPPVGLASGLEELVGFAGDLDVAVPAGLDEDVRRIEVELSSTSPWLAYCPGDTCPDNNRVLADGTVRFFDFEGSGWRHAATEAAYCRVPFCTCWCVAGLPDGMTAAMEDASCRRHSHPSVTGSERPSAWPPSPGRSRRPTSSAASWRPDGRSARPTSRRSVAASTPPSVWAPSRRNGPGSQPWPRSPASSERRSSTGGPRRPRSLRIRLSIIRRGSGGRGG